MSNTSFFHSIIRFIKRAYNYLSNLLSKSFLKDLLKQKKEYLKNTTFVEEEQKVTKNNSIETDPVKVPKQQSLTYVYISRIGDKHTITEFRENLKKHSNNKIVDKYNSIERLYGAHQQVLYIIALNQEFISRFGKTPIQIEENCLISLGSKIIYMNDIDNFVFVDEV